MSRKSRNLKPLNQSDYQMKIIKDLGMIWLKPTNKRHYRSAIFECTKCGGEQIYSVDSAKNKKTKVCLKCSYKTRGEKHTKHGDYKTRLYKIYIGMKTRCLQVDGRDYKRYGAKGITIEDSFSTFEKFKKWSLKNGYTKVLTIDRINNEGNYSSSNCRWADYTTQNCNRKTSNHIGIYINKKAKTVTYDTSIKYYNKIIYRKRYKTMKEAIEARNKFIIENNLPHTLNQVCPR